jgi:hypothetical protein
MSYLDFERAKVIFCVLVTQIYQKYMNVIDIIRDISDIKVTKRDIKIILIEMIDKMIYFEMIE